MNTIQKLVVALLLAFVASLHAFLFFQRRKWAIPPREKEAVPSGRPRKLILSWTGFFKHRHFMDPSLEALKCPVHDCDITTDRGRFGDSHALLFHWFNVNTSDLPSRKLPGQKWAMMSFESPVHAPRQLSALAALEPDIDWTVTYSPDSDFPSPYGLVRNRSLAFDGSPPPVPDSSLPKRPVAWMVSHCRTSSKRELLVRQLRMHVPVDIYGGCKGNPSLRRLAKKRAYQFLAQRYKMYLSFENALCKDYATEKAFLPLQQGLIPVVLGGADYERLLPQGSYIDALSFGSVRELAAHLQDVHRNHTLYASYFRWRQLSLVSKAQNDNDFFCKICEQLHRTGTAPVPTPAGSGEAGFNFWRSGKTQCLVVGGGLGGLNFTTVKRWRDAVNNRDVSSPV